MKNNKKKLSSILSTFLCVALMPLAGCDKKTDNTAATSASQVLQAQAASSYVPPTPDQLYQLVGPIALFPDKLVAQVLAASSYPDQVSAANNWLAQNKNLQGSQRQDAVNQQPWDVSVKGLMQFPNVLEQMARNISWISALGDAYVNDPGDVMNAIQVMRQRAAGSGNLKNTKQQRITVAPRAREAPPGAYAEAPHEPPVYSGPEVIPPPPQTIVIEPAEPGVVYVPDYNPGVVYGEPLPVYPGYYYAPGETATAGVMTFGLGVVVGAAIGYSDWGWNSWGVRWGGGNWNGGWRRPAVVYNNNTYVSRSTTIVNRVTNNYNNSTVINNRSNAGPGLAGNSALADGMHPGRPHAQPDFNNMTRPDFNRVPQSTVSAIAPNANQLARPALVPPGPNARPMPNRLQQNAQPRAPARPRHLEMEKSPVNLNQHPFGGNLQRPNISHPAAPQMARPQPFQAPQNVRNRPQELFQNRPEGVQQIRPEINRPGPTPAVPVFNRQEARPQPQVRPQMSAQPPHQLPQNHEQPHRNDNPHPDKRNEEHK